MQGFKTETTRGSMNSTCGLSPVKLVHDQGDHLGDRRMTGANLLT